MATTDSSRSSAPPPPAPLAPGAIGDSGFYRLPPKAREDHRAKVALRAESILGQFWRDDSTPAPIRALEMEGWADVLETCSHSEIRAAWAQYQKSGPRTAAGRLLKPDAGALYRIVQQSRPRPTPPAPPPEPPRDRVTAERARAILAEVYSQQGEQA